MLDASAYNQIIHCTGWAHRKFRPEKHCSCPSGSHQFFKRFFNIRYINLKYSNIYTVVSFWHSLKWQWGLLETQPVNHTAPVVNSHSGCRHWDPVAMGWDAVIDSLANEMESLSEDVESADGCRESSDHETSSESKNMPNTWWSRRLASVVSANRMVKWLKAPRPTSPVKIVSGCTGCSAESEVFKVFWMQFLDRKGLETGFRFQNHLSKHCCSWFVFKLAPSNRCKRYFTL